MGITMLMRRPPLRRALPGRWRQFRAPALAVACWLLGTLAVSAFSGSLALAAGDVNEASCQNESLTGFQPFLPDCRAYELVSPVYKNSNEIARNPQAVAADGSRVVVTQEGSAAIGPDAGLISGSYSATELIRGPGGWTSSTLSLPASSAPGQALYAASADLQKTVWTARRPTEAVSASNLYRREMDGSVREIGPEEPPGATGNEAGGSFPGIDTNNLESTLGFSSDVSHVLFEANGGLWLGDNTINPTVTANPSLYEYVGLENSAPSLVGINTGGALISRCGTSLGSYGSSDTYNAVSATGEVVLFTAYGVTEPGVKHQACLDATLKELTTGPSVDELYARVGGLPVNTVPISQPPESACAACRTATASATEPAVEPKPAEFAGASEDGSKVFFTTEQELLAGATTKNLYEYDFGRPQGQKVLRLSTGSPTPEIAGVARVSRDGSHVYFVAHAALTGANREGNSPLAGANNLYVSQAGHPTFVTTLSSETPAELQAAEAPCVALPEAERATCEAPLVEAFQRTNARDEQDWASVDARPVQTTPDGRFLVFQSAADLTPGDTSTQPQVFEYDSQTETLTRTSIGAAGYAAGQASVDARGAILRAQEFVTPATAPDSKPFLAISADGSLVTFTSTGALSPQALPAAAAGAASVYEYRSQGPITDGHVYLISDGDNAVGATVAGMSASGSDLFFDTRDALVPQDLDSRTDLYDARVGGGFSPLAVSSPCDREACQGALSPAAISLPIPSVDTPAGGNLPPPPTPTTTTRPKTNVSTRAQRLAHALRLCRRKRAGRRKHCEAGARKRYGTHVKTEQRGRR